MKFEYPKRQIPAIPIVALIDILVILLIFFIVTMQPKKKRPILDVSMPTVTEVEVKQIVEPRTVLAMSQNGEITLGPVKISDERQLVNYLTLLKENNPYTKLELELDKRVRLEQMIMIYEALTKAGFEANLPTRVREAKS
ncbi:hypothetical protein Rhal01_00174 [Rubritalea halochordaticola]|uniref:Biopolymer transporter ExbD n=1 Tax=Rubritalea halochordaticola TaxID=714537 RepID=A0ABP9UWI0_9BACT